MTRKRLPLNRRSSRIQVQKEISPEPMPKSRSKSSNKKKAKKPSHKRPLARTAKKVKSTLKAKVSTKSPKKKRKLPKKHKRKEKSSGKKRKKQRVVSLNKEQQALNAMSPNQAEESPNCNNVLEAASGDTTQKKLRFSPQAQAEPEKRTESQLKAASAQKEEEKQDTANIISTAVHEKEVEASEVLKPSKSRGIVDSSWMKMAKETLQTLMANPRALLFLEPVDWKALGIPDYPEIIKSPMDFSTCMKKLEAHVYKDETEYCADMRLIFTNAKTYNQLGSHVYTLAEALSTQFERIWRRKSRAQVAVKRSLPTTEAAVSIISDKAQRTQKKRKSSPMKKKENPKKSFKRTEAAATRRRPITKDPVKKVRKLSTLTRYDLTADQLQTNGNENIKDLRYRFTASIRHLQKNELAYVVRQVKQQKPESFIETLDAWEIDVEKVAHFPGLLRELVSIAEQAKASYRY